MSDLSQSGILEMVADNILFAYRDEYYNADTSIGNLLELILAKARHGETGKVELLFDKSCGMIDSLVEYEAMIRSWVNTKRNPKKYSEHLSWVSYRFNRSTTAV